MARIAANPRIEADVLTAGVWQLMADAMDVSYVEFERRALIFESLADPIGAAEKTERNHQRRNAVMHHNTDGGWNLHACFDEVGGPEFLEIFSWFVDREFNNDWAAAIREFGDGNVDVTKLRRTEAPCRCRCHLGNGTSRRGVPTRPESAVTDSQLPDRRQHRRSRR